MKSKWLVLFAVVLFMGIGSEAFAKEEVWKDKNLERNAGSAPKVGHKIFRIQ